MTERSVVLWPIDDDVVDVDRDQQYRTVIAHAGGGPTPLSIVLATRSAAAGRPAEIVAVGQATGGRPVSTGRIGVRVDPFWVLDLPVDVGLIRSRLDRHGATAFDAGLAAEPINPVRLTKKAGRKILGAVAATSSEAKELIGRLESTPQIVDGSDGRRLREERDAVQTCFQLADLVLPAEMARDRTAPIQSGEAFGASLEPYFVTDSEDDLIAEELHRFDPTSTIRRLTGSASAIIDKDLRLTVVNVNRKPLEHVHGVDLVYYDHITGQGTVVQYKRLDPFKVTRDGNTATEWYFKRRSELVKQLGLMKLPTRAAAPSAAEWRLAPTPGFFKFVRGEDFDPDDRSVLRGMYIPADYLELCLRDGVFNSGPRGGFQLGYPNSRYLSREVFTQLVRRGWIGTTSHDQSTLASMVAELAKRNEVVLGIRSSRK